MSFSLINPATRLKEIIYKNKNSPSTGKVESGAARIELSKIEVGQHKNKGVNYVIANFTFQIDAHAFFLYGEGEFKAEIYGVSNEMLNQEDYQNKVVQFARTHHEPLIKEELQRIISSILSLGAMNPAVRENP